MRAMQLNRFSRLMRDSGEKWSDFEAAVKVDRKRRMRRKIAVDMEDGVER